MWHETVKTKRAIEHLILHVLIAMKANDRLKARSKYGIPKLDKK